MTAATYKQKDERLWRTLTRKERWGLSLRGRLIVIALIVLGIASFLVRIYPYLAVTHRVDAKVLVVEGWVHEYAIRAAVREFRSSPYQRVFTTGGPVEGTGGYTNDYNTSASVGGNLLKKFGLPAGNIEMVPSHVIDRDRTYSSAIALRNWFRDRNTAVQSVNIVTESVHARRTRLLFEKALGPEASIGIISIPNPDYNPKRWWRCSEGVRDVLGETVAYLYSKLCFYPPGEVNSKRTRRE